MLKVKENAEAICYMLTSLVSLQEGNDKKIEKLIKIGNIEEENSLYLLNELSNFNEIFREDVTYDNIKSPKKTGIHDFSE